MTESTEMEAHSALSAAVETCADASGLTVRIANTTDASALNQAHLRFTMEMQEWNPRSKNDTVPDSDASGIKMLIEDEPECIILLTRELIDCRGRTSQVVGFVYSYDDGPSANDKDNAAVRRRSIRRHSGSGSTGPSCYIAEVYIEPQERGRGLGEILVGAALAAALKRRTNDVHLYVTHRNHAAVGLYEKIGFKDVGKSSDAVHDRLMKIADLQGTRQPIDILHARAAKQAKMGDDRRTTRSVGGARKKPPPAPSPTLPLANAGGKRVPGKRQGGPTTSRKSSHSRKLARIVVPSRATLSTPDGIFECALCGASFASPRSLGGHRRHGCASTGGPQGTRACLATHAQKKAAAKLSTATLPRQPSPTTVMDFKGGPKRSPSREKKRPATVPRAASPSEDQQPCPACMGRHRAHTCGLQKMKPPPPSSQQQQQKTAAKAAPRPKPVTKPAATKSKAATKPRPKPKTKVVAKTGGGTSKRKATAKAASSSSSSSSAASKSAGKRAGTSAATASRKRTSGESQEGTRRGNPRLRTTTTTSGGGGRRTSADDSGDTPPREAQSEAAPAPATAAAAGVGRLRAKRQRVPVKAPPSFAFTGFGIGTPKVLLNKLDTRVRSLGCRVSTSTGWDASCSHLIIDLGTKSSKILNNNNSSNSNSNSSSGGVASRDTSTGATTTAAHRLPRTEKLLCALASGQPVLTAGYVKACAAAGSLIDSSPYDCRTLFPQLLPAANAKPFLQMRAVVLCESAEKTAGLSMILRAGGAEVVPEEDLQAFYEASLSAQSAAGQEVEVEGGGSQLLQPTSSASSDCISPPSSPSDADHAGALRRSSRGGSASIATGAGASASATSACPQRHGGADAGDGGERRRITHVLVDRESDRSCRVLRQVRRRNAELEAEPLTVLVASTGDVVEHLTHTRRPGLFNLA